MSADTGKHVVCITGAVWTGSRSAPRKLLVRDGFRRPTWFTTGRGINDAEYERISPARFHLSLARREIFVHAHHGGDDIGILNRQFEQALAASTRGVLVVGPEEIAEQVLAYDAAAVVFALELPDMKLSARLSGAARRGQLHRLDVDFSEVGVWTKIHQRMLRELGVKT
jgi:hypothetical protein